tara:strand:- start:862 stop:1047 length:186 start_codon:yes stop_codon:yes gene_type:complete
VRFKITGSSSAIAKGEWLLGENDWTPTHLLDHSITTNLLGEATDRPIDKIAPAFVDLYNAD